MLNLIRQTTVFSILSVWTAVMTFVSVSLMIGHWVQLPCPTIGTMQPVDLDSCAIDSQKWRAIHFLYSDCKCSQSILRHLLERQPLKALEEKEIEETIVLVGDPKAHGELIENSKYTFELLTPEQLKQKYNVEAAPLMVVLDPDRFIRYSGAYTTRKQGFHIQDVSLIQRTLAGKIVQPLPLYGCGVSRELRALTDPFGLKRTIVN